MIKINDKVFFLHWKDIRIGIVKGIYTKRVNLQVDFIIHQSLTIDESECFESPEKLCEDMICKFKKQ